MVKDTTVCQKLERFLVIFGLLAFTIHVSIAHVLAVYAYMLAIVLHNMGGFSVYGHILCVMRAMSTFFPNVKHLR